MPQTHRLRHVCAVFADVGFHNSHPSSRRALL
jgi:hypothetical protein